MRHVDKDLAKTLQELGYDGDFEKYWCAIDHDGKVKWYLSYGRVSDFKPIPAPRLDDVAYWIRKKYNLFAHVAYLVSFCSWAYTIQDVSAGEHYDVIGEGKWDLENSFVDALEAAVKKR